MKKNFIYFLFFSILSTVIIYMFLTDCKEDAQTASVTGRIYGKNIESVLSGKHHRHYHTEYVFALDPDNPKYHNTVVNVSFATYSAYNVGDKITFPELELRNVDSSFKENPEWLGFIEFFSCIIFVAATIAYAFKLSDDISDYFYDKKYNAYKKHRY